MVFVFLQWQAISLTVIEKVQIAAAILGSLFLMASISWLVWSSFSPSARWQRQDLLFQICYGMYGFMDVVCIGELYYSLVRFKVDTSCWNEFATDSDVKSKSYSRSIIKPASCTQVIVDAMNCLHCIDTQYNKSITQSQQLQINIECLWIINIVWMIVLPVFVNHNTTVTILKVYKMYHQISLTELNSDAECCRN